MQSASVQKFQVQVKLQLMPPHARFHHLHMKGNLPVGTKMQRELSQDSNLWVVCDYE